MKLPAGLKPEEIRVLQEYRRVGQTELEVGQLRAIRHPVDRGDEPLRGLVAKGFLTADGGGERFVLTERGKALLANSPEP